MYFLIFCAGDALRGITLRCVGLLDSRYIGDPLTDNLVILAEYSSTLIGAPDNFYCGVSHNGLRLYMYVYIPYSRTLQH